MKKLNRAVKDVVESSGRSSSPLLEKQEEMNDLYKTVALMAKDRQNQLHDILKEVSQENKTMNMININRFVTYLSENLCLIVAYP